MAARLWGRLALVGLGVAIGSGWSALASTSLYMHMGYIVEHISRVPLDATVWAWPETKRAEMNGSCPAYGATPLDTKDSSGGQFGIFVENSHTAYTLVYCRNGYVPRVEYQENLKNKTPVRPQFVELWPQKISDQEREQYDEDIADIVIGFLNSFSYFRTVDESRFEASVNRVAQAFPDSRAAAIRSLPKLAAEWRNEAPK